MLVSIIVPAYNAERFLDTTISSVLAQTLPTWELILVDDGSKDGTLAICQRYAAQDSRIRVFSKANAGCAAARNFGFEHSDPAADYVAFFDHDDIWHPHALETLVTAAESLPGSIGAQGLGELIDESGKPYQPGHLEGIGRHRYAVLKNRVEAWPISEPTTFEVEVCGNRISTMGQVLIRRSTLQAVGPLDLEMVPSDDWDLYLRLLLHGPMAFVDKVVIGWRQHPNNTSKHKNLMQSASAAVRRKVATLPELTEEQRRYIALVERLSRQHLIRSQLGWAGQSLSRGQLRDAGLQLRYAVGNMLRARN